MLFEKMRVIDPLTVPFHLSEQAPSSSSVLTPPSSLPNKILVQVFRLRLEQMPAIISDYINVLYLDLAIPS